MSCFSTFLLLLLAANVNVVSCRKQLEVVEMAREGMQQAIAWAQGIKALNGPGRVSGFSDGSLRDCVKLYEEAESRLARLVSGKRDDHWSHDDAVTWLSAALTSHITCLDGLRENGLPFEAQRAENLTSVTREALAVYRAESSLKGKRKVVRRPGPNQVGGLLATWNAAMSKADFVVAQDGSGNYKTINEAVAALARSGRNRPRRVVVYVKSGVYKEKVEIGRDLNNIMFVGDGIDKTIVTAQSECTRWCEHF